MKNSNILILIALVSLLFSSCATHQGMMTGNAALADNDFRVVDVAVGTAKTAKVFGIGGLKSDALILDAKKNLYSRYPLKTGQALANVTVDFKRSYYFIVYTTKVTISADIIDFGEAPSRQEVYYQKQAEQLPPAEDEGVEEVEIVEVEPVLEEEPAEELGTFRLGEEVYIKNGMKASKAKIIQIKKNKYNVQVLGEGSSKTRFTNEKNLFKIEDARAFSENKTFNVEDIVKFTTYGTGNPPTQVVRYGSIVGMGRKSAVVKYLDQGKEAFIVLPYKELRKR